MYITRSTRDLRPPWISLLCTFSTKCMVVQKFVRNSGGREKRAFYKTGIVHYQTKKYNIKRD